MVANVAGELGEFRALTKKVGRTVAHQRERPTSWIRLLPVQHAYVYSRKRFRLLRSGNQVGKTFGALYDLYLHAIGKHPTRRCSKPGAYWVVCVGWPESVEIQGKLDEIMDRDRIGPETAPFHKKNGFGAKKPMVWIRHESGAYSTIEFKTAGQDEINFSSATIDGVLFDEPPPSLRMYMEACKRVMKRGGWVSIAMTPVNRPTAWVRKREAAGLIEDHHARMTVENLTPIGSRSPIRLDDGTLCNQVWIDKERALTPLHEAPVTLDGEWEMRSEGRWFAQFISTPDVPGSHVHDRLPAGRLFVCLGADHGDKPGKQQFWLVVVSPPIRKVRNYPSVYVLDGCVDEEGGGLPEDDANGLLGMLRAHGMKWASVDYARGDRIHRPGEQQQKSNTDLQAAIAKILKVPASDLKPPIRSAKKGQGRGGGAVMVGSRWLYHAMVRDEGFAVHPRCARMIKALDNYDPKVDDEHKDAVDALRYALDEFIYDRWERGTVGVRFG